MLKEMIIKMKEIDSEKVKKLFKNKYFFNSVIVVLVLSLIVIGVFISTRKDDKKTPHFSSNPVALAPLFSVPKAKDALTQKDNLDPGEIACSKFIDLGLNCTFAREYSNTIPRDTLISQDLPAGKKVTKGVSINLKYSYGPSSSTFPEIRSYDLKTAKNILYPFGFTLGKVKYLNDSGLAKGLIVSSNVSSGSQQKWGKTVDVNVSSGKVTVPYWIGKSEQSVTSDAQSKNINVKFIEQKSVVPAGIVISESPQKGLMDSTKYVTLTVSSGKSDSKVSIPKIVGMTPQDAQSALAIAGFQQIKVVNTYTNGTTASIVTKVTPGIGTAANVADTITLTVDNPSK